MASRHDGFLLDFTRIFVYPTAILQEIKTSDVFRALFEADMHLYDSILRASRNAHTPWEARKAPIHGDVRASDTTPPTQSRRNPMTRVSRLFVSFRQACLTSLYGSVTSDLSLPHLPSTGRHLITLRGARRVSTPHTAQLSPPDSSEPCRSRGPETATGNRSLSPRRVRGVDPDRSSPHRALGGRPATLPCRRAVCAGAPGQTPAAGCQAPAAAR